MTHPKHSIHHHHSLSSSTLIPDAHPCPKCDGEGSIEWVGGPGHYSEGYGNWLPSEGTTACEECGATGYITTGTCMRCGEMEANCECSEDDLDAFVDAGHAEYTPVRAYCSNAGCYLRAVDTMTQGWWDGRMYLDVGCCAACGTQLTPMRD